MFWFQRMISLLLLVCCLGSLVSSAPRVYDLEKLNTYFGDFVKTYNKSYSSGSEKKESFETLKKNVDFLSKIAGSSGFDVTEHFDMPAKLPTFPTGFRKTEGSQQCNHVPAPQNVTAPESWDWRDQGAVTRVKDKRYVFIPDKFSIVGNVEGQYAIKYKKLVDLSVSQINDCACFGIKNIMLNSLYLLRVGGLMTDDDDPFYPARNMPCQFDPAKVEAHVTGCNRYILKSEEELKETLFSVGPLAITLHGNSISIYNGGIMKYCPRRLPNFPMLLVGYGAENGTEYWTLKNCMGEHWGEDGYIRILRNVNACSILEGTISSVVLA